MMRWNDMEDCDKRKIIDDIIDSFNGEGEMSLFDELRKRHPEIWIKEKELFEFMRGDIE